jgi:hypothetical protein
MEYTMMHLDFIKLPTTAVNTTFHCAQTLFCCVVGGEGWFAMLGSMSVVSKENHTFLNWSYMSWFRQQICHRGRDMAVCGRG